MTWQPAPGVRIGSYEISAHIGSGGMGEVWRAHDTRLHREVALKILPDNFASDRERVLRFEREAQVLASLNHPNIGQIHHLVEAGESKVLVLELVEGPTLAELLERAPMPILKALRTAKQIAEALESSHELGVIHRDLKPSNVKLRSDGTVKLLDFGLAKAYDASQQAHAEPDAPTVTSLDTNEGVVLGTAAYMSPEQARGKTVDKRTDIWSFGCILFEMLTGRSAFRGETTSDTIARILGQEPPWSVLPESVGERLRLTLHRCLEKDLSRRCRDIGDARLEIEDALSARESGGSDSLPPMLPGQRQPDSSTDPARPETLGRPVAGAFAAIGVGALLGGGIVWNALDRQPAEPSRASTRFLLQAPAEGPLWLTDAQPDVAISPDGSKVVWRTGFAREHGGPLFLRHLDRLEAEALEGTKGRQGPVFSPDGEWVAFEDVHLHALKKVPVLGGSTSTISNLATGTRGISWGVDNNIVFATEEGGGLYRVSAEGGVPAQLTQLDSATGETNHWWPDVLPNGKAALFTARMRPVEANRVDQTSIGAARIAVVSFDTGEVTYLVSEGSYARYSPSGHIIYGVGGTLLAVGFDPDRLQVTTRPTPVMAHVSMKRSGAANFSLSGNGSLVFVTAAAEQGQRELVWVDMHGNEEPLPLPRRAYNHPRLSPEGRYLVVAIAGSDNQDLWIYDFELAIFSQLTYDGGDETHPLWTPDGQQVVFASNQDGRPGLFRINKDGSGGAERLTDGVGHKAYTWALDGRLLMNQPNGIDALTLDGSRTPVLASTPVAEYPALSSNGEWLAYSSNEGTGDRIFVRQYPNLTSGRWLISSEDGDDASWSHDGTELYYMQPGKMFAVSVETEPPFRASPPRLLFSGDYVERSGVQYDLAPDGTRFLMLKEMVPGENGESQPQLTVVLNWAETLVGHGAPPD